MGCLLTTAALLKEAKSLTSDPAVDFTFQGLAYVEYENESQASQAVMKMDGMTIKENVIKVAISNPPQRKFPEKPEVRTAPGAPMVPRQMYGA